MCKRALVYGLALAAGTALLQWLDYRHLARAQSETVYIAVIAVAFLALGAWAGVKLLGHRAPPAPPFDGNPQAQAGGAWVAEIPARAGASCGASQGAGEALVGYQQRVGNEGWPRKSPRPEGLNPQGGRFSVAPLARAESPGCTPRLASPPLRAQREPESLPPTLPGISPRELEVLEKLAAGLSNKEIADQLNVSPHTVKTHVAKLFEKLGARRRTEAILKARELGLLR